ncbi:MAG: sigma-70 family RNA polymerase sigma factor [Chloroflexales bacterium]|nr:sigma-70 family RNA polymerase sigma factor [Chloroflexales bacterium]
MALSHDIPNQTAPRPTESPDHLSVADVADTELAQMEIGLLAGRASIEHDRFVRRQPSDTRFAYELFRRALVERNELAWTQLYRLYASLIERWAQYNRHLAQSGETTEFFVSEAFTRFWRAIGPDRFAAFPALATLLQYLQLCTSCAVMDSARTQSWNKVVPEESIAEDETPIWSAQEEIVEQVCRAEFWEYICTLLRSEAERVVILGLFVAGMKPGDIYHQRQDLFSSVHAVYMVRRTVLARLGRSRELRQMTYV